LISWYLRLLARISQLSHEIISSGVSVGTTNDGFPEVDDDDPAVVGTHARIKQTAVTKEAFPISVRLRVSIVSHGTP
jgi:hypothetical protein